MLLPGRAFNQVIVDLTRGLVVVLRFMCVLAMFSMLAVLVPVESVMLVSVL